MSTKTPKQIAKEYIEQEQLEYDEASGAYYGFLAGYKAGVEAEQSKYIKCANAEWIEKHEQEKKDK